MPFLMVWSILLRPEESDQKSDIWGIEQFWSTKKVVSSQSKKYVRTCIKIRMCLKMKMVWDFAYILIGLCRIWQKVNNIQDIRVTIPVVSRRAIRRKEMRPMRPQTKRSLSKMMRLAARSLRKRTPKREKGSLSKQVLDPPPASICPWETWLVKCLPCSRVKVRRPLTRPLIKILKRVKRTIFWRRAKPVMRQMRKRKKAKVSISKTLFRRGYTVLWPSCVSLAEADTEGNVLEVFFVFKLTHF